jgi:hypothetical protein
MMTERIGSSCYDTVVPVARQPIVVTLLSSKCPPTHPVCCTKATKKSIPANPQPVPDCGPGATRCAPRACSLGHPVTLPFAAITGGSCTPAGTALRLAPERGKRRRDWLRASPSARAGNRLRASPAAQGKRQASPVGGVSPSFCCHSFHLIHPLFLAAPTFRLVELAGCGAGLLSCFLSGPGRLPHGLSAS